MFKKIAIALAIGSSTLFVCTAAFAEDVSPPAMKPSTNSFFNDASYTGTFGLWMRNRTRDKIIDGIAQGKQPNLDHGSLYFAVDFKSGYIDDIIGADINLYATYDLWQNGSPDHEMNFWGVNNPYEMYPTSSSGCKGIWTSTCNENGGQIQTAALKFKFGQYIIAKAGYFQPSVPTTLGVNWSYAAGTYIGGEVGLNIGKAKFGFVIADAYRAPWYKDSYSFRTGTGASAKEAGSAYSLGFEYQFQNDLLVQVAYGALTIGERKNAQIKFKYTSADGIYISPQVYIVEDDNQYDGTAYQLALITSFSAHQYTFRAESTYTVAPSSRGDVGNMAYRLTEAYGGSNGAYDVYWNNRSDFNHDNELAVFGEVARDLADLGMPGLKGGFNAVYAFGAKAEGFDELIEYSGSLFLNYGFQKGSLKGTNMGIYYTQYVNASNAPAWKPYSNAFQDESDLKLTFVMPFDF